MRTSDIVKQLLRKFGYTLTLAKPNTDAWARRKVLIASEGIDMLIDIGGHHGNYCKKLREGGYRGLILSFEPQQGANQILLTAAAKSPPWEVFQLALSDYEGEGDFFVSSRDTSSSLQQMVPEAQAMAHAMMIDRQRVQVRTLDSVLSERGELRSKLYIKCDAQGAEERIMTGATRSLELAYAVEVELSIAEMYEGQWDFRSALDWFAGNGFELYSLEAGFADPTSGRVMQVDAIFVRC